MAFTADRFRATIAADGLWAGMRWLNAMSRYRFTAVFAFDGDLLRNLCLVDKEDTNVKSCADQPITESYCIFIQRSGEPFSVRHALKDERVVGHPKQRSYQCYYGIPLLGRDGKLLGTVCHFDKDAVPVSGDVVTALDDVAPVIAEAAFGERWSA
jgi:GAF domain-containing protein